MNHKGTPTWRHDCNRCHFLGQTIGGMKIVDLYVCDTRDDSSARPFLTAALWSSDVKRATPRGHDSSPTLIARYGDEGSEYLSIDANYAHPNGHSELYAAADLWRRENLEDRS